MAINRKAMPRTIGGYRARSSYERDQERLFRARRMRHTIAYVAIWLVLALIWRVLDAGI